MLALCLAGCQRGPYIVQIEGKATRNKQPVANLFVNFVPEQGRPSWGSTDEQGRFALKYDAAQDGAVVGKHKVFVSFRPSSPREELQLQRGEIKLHPERQAIVEKYGDPSSSPLVVEIKEQGQQVHLELD